MGKEKAEQLSKIYPYIQIIDWGKNISFDIFYGVSNNSWRYWDLSHSSKILGYTPKYNAEEHRK